MRKGFIKFSLIFAFTLQLILLSTAFSYAKSYKVSTPQSISITKRLTAFLFTPENKKNLKNFNIRRNIQQTSSNTGVSTGQTDTSTAVLSNSSPAQTQSQLSQKQSQSKIENKNFYQLAPPVKGEEIAVIKTNVGSIKIKLLSDYAPKTVAFFKERVNNGFYNGTEFFKVVPNSMIQGGQQSQGSTISTDQLDDFNSEVRNFRGAVSLVYSDSNSPQDQFLIVQADATNIVNDPLNYMIKAGETQFPKYVINQYRKIGGAPWLDFHNVVFGQVIKGKQGLDTLDQISQQEVDESNKPKKEIKIIKINIITN